MNMYQKRLTRILFIVVAVALIDLTVNSAFVKKLEAIVEQPTPSPSNSVSPTPALSKPIITASQNPVDNKWITFHDNRFSFEFLYPVGWSVLNKLDDPNGLQFWLEEKNMASMIMDIENGIKLALIGISYCGAYPQDKRCESLKNESGDYVMIDWGENGEANAMFGSRDGTVGVSFTLHIMSSETKVTFRKILSTFKFLE